MASAFAGLVEQLELHAVRAQQPKVPKAMTDILEAMEEAGRPVSPRELAVMVGRTYHNTRWWIQLLRRDGLVYYTKPVQGKVSLNNPGGWQRTRK